MTIIAVHGRSMAADTFTTDGVTRDLIPAGTSKIVRAPDGSLFGACGAADNTYALKEWARAGMDFAKPPPLRREDDDGDSNYWIWLKPDETVFYGGMNMMVYPAPAYASIGISNARVVVKLALKLGKTLKQALYLAFEECLHVGGDVHMLTLETPETPQVHVANTPRLVVTKGIACERPPALVIPDRY